MKSTGDKCEDCFATSVERHDCWMYEKGIKEGIPLSNQRRELKR